MAWGTQQWGTTQWSGSGIPVEVESYLSCGSVIVELDNFSDGTVLPTMSGNGTVTETGGNMVVSMGAGQNGGWLSTRYGIAPYWEIQRDANYSIMNFETTLDSYSTGDATYSRAVYALWESDSRYYWIYSDDGINWGVYRNFSGSTRYLGNYSGNPVSTPTRIRFNWGIAGDVVRFHIFDNNDWQDIAPPEKMAINPTRIVWYSENRTAEPAVTSQFSQFRACASTGLLTRSTSYGGMSDEVIVIDHTAPKMPGVAGEVADGIALGTASIDDRLTQSGEVVEGQENWLSGTPLYSRYTADAEGHSHLTAERNYLFHYYSSTDEPWANPTTTGWTGYAKDGYLYSNGVSQGTQAPWATETSSNNRSSRSDFPDRAVIVVNDGELIIFDADTFPVSLDVWMRFLIGDSSNYYLAGRIAQSITDVKMLNGVLAITSKDNGPDNGGLSLIDFRATNQKFINLIRSNAHYHGVSGRDITDRNITGNFTQTGVSPSLRFPCESLYQVQMYNGSDQSRIFAAVMGDDESPRIVETNRATSIPGTIHIGTGLATASLGAEMGPANSDIRRMTFDRSGWMWWCIGGRLFRAMSDWEQGVIVASEETQVRRYRPQAFIRLPYNITHLASSGKNVYAATSEGVYQINRFTMEFHLAYTAPGGGGGGKGNVSPLGEILVGNNSTVASLSAFESAAASYLHVGTYWRARGEGGSLVIRLDDDFLFDVKIFPELLEPGVHFVDSYRA